MGRQEYSIGKYQNVIRATVPIIYIEDKTQNENVLLKMTAETSETR
ncbi:MAG: hypothetical protein ACRD5E_10420 [Nitrososphaeraceae archaeon]